MELATGSGGGHVAQLPVAAGQQRHALAQCDLSVGVWGRRCALAAGLRDRDRVAIYRPLTVDPKQARRLRYKRAKGATDTKPVG